MVLSKPASRGRALETSLVEIGRKEEMFSINEQEEEGRSLLPERRRNRPCTKNRRIIEGRKGSFVSKKEGGP